MEDSGPSETYYMEPKKLVKRSFDNETEWSSLYIDSIQKVIKTSDNGYLAVGKMSKSNTILSTDTVSGEKIELTNNGGKDAIIVKYDSNGKVEWAKSTGSMGKDDYVSAVEKIIEKEDGTQETQYVITGNFSGVSKEINGLIGAATVIYNSNGDIISSQSMYESSQNILDVVKTDDGGSIAVGWFSGKLEMPTKNGEKIELYSSGEKDGLVTKYNANGEIEWAQKIGGGSGEIYNAIDNVDGGFVTVGIYYGNLVIPAEDTIDNKEIIFEGNTNGYGIIVRYNKDGKIEFAKRILGNSCSINDVKKTEDGYVVVGNSKSDITISAEDTVGGSKDLILSASGTRGIIIKYDNNNKVEWAKAGESDSNYTKVAYKNSEYVATGTLTTEKNLIVKYDDSGKVKFSNTLDVMYYKENVEGVIQTDDGGVIVVGTPQANLTIPAEQTVDGKEIILPSGAFKGYIVKYNSEGLVEFAKTVVDNVNTLAYINDLCETEDNGYIIAIGGTKSLKIFKENTADGEEINCISDNNTSTAKILKFNKDNKVEWCKDLQKDSNYRQMAIYSKDNRYIVACNINDYNAWISEVQLDILSPEVPRSKLLQVQNTPITYKITGEVQGEGGTITIGKGLTEEKVRYNNNSKEDIVIKPETSEYQVSSIMVKEGEVVSEIPFTPDANGVVTLEKFKNVLLNKHIIVKFSKISESSKVIVHHYLWKDEHTTEEKLSPDEYISGEIGSNYITTPKVDLEGYELIKNKDILGETGANPDEYYIPENASGTVADNIIVTYYYKLKTYNLTIHHYLEGTTTNIAPTVIKAGIDTGTRYEILVEKNNNQKYKITTKLDRLTQEKELDIDERRYKKTLVVGEETGDITKDTEITYYYVDTAFDLKVEKIWEDNKNEGNTRPENLEIQVLGNNEIIDKYTLNVTNDENSHIFKNMYKYATDESVLKYEVQETEVPEGYYIKELSEQNNNYIITNAKLGSITINKIDKSTKEKLKGAEFKIEKQEGENWKEIGNVITDENGQAQISKLEHGKYKITETKAPDGYNLNKETKEIEINNTQIDLQLEIANRPGIKLPLTGGMGTALLITIGISAMGISSILIKKGKK